jgi:hypothetical protein
MTEEATQMNSGKIWRFHSTSRMVLCPKRKSDDFKARMKKNMKGKLLETSEYHSNSYKHCNVLSKCTAYEVDTNNYPNAQPDKHDLPTKKRRIDSISKNTQPINLLSPANTDRYVQMKPRDFDDLNIVRPLPTMLFEGSMLSHLSSAPMTKFLFDHGYVVHSMVPMGTVSEKRGVPRLHEVPVVNTTGQKRHPIPGEKFLLSCICGDAGMNHTRRAHPMLCPDDGTHPRLIIITRAYKNDWKSVQAHIQALDGWEEDKSKPLYTDNFDGKLTVFGSGGAPEILGTHPPNYKKDTKYDSQVHIPSAQPLETSKTNQALLKMKLENQCVAVYVNRDEMFETDEAYSAARPPNCCFLGYFRCVLTGFRLSNNHSL